MFDNKNSSTHTLWVEKWRPDTLEGYIGNEVLKERFATYIKNQDIPHLLFYGTAGTGKTTAAKILIKNIDCDYLFINASDERGIDVIRDKIKSFAASSGFAPLKIVVLDEADALTGDAQSALRNMMEVFSKSTRFILTANYVERITSPIVSRCQATALTPPSKKDVAKHLAKILESEGVSYTTQDIVLLINAHYPDIRRIINTAQQQTVDGALSLNSAEIVSSDVPLRVLDILTSNQTSINKLISVRKVVVESSVRDYIPLYRLLYDKVEECFPEDVPNAIIQIGEGQFRDNFTPDKEITFMATLYNILFKD